MFLNALSKDMLTIQTTATGAMNPVLNVGVQLNFNVSIVDRELDCIEASAMITARQLPSHLCTMTEFARNASGDAPHVQAGIAVRCVLVDFTFTMASVFVSAP